MLTFEDITKMHSKAFSNNQITRERACDDMVFYWVTQWDDNLLGQTQLDYKGEFNILRKAGRQIIQDLRSNPVQVNFEPVDESRMDGGDLIDGIYRTDDRRNTSIESHNNASSESVVCGFGAWELYTEYESNRAGDERQVIRRGPIHNAPGTVFFDPNARLMDKSDARYCSWLAPYSPDGYKELREDLGLDDCGGSFANPEISYSFPWVGAENDTIYVCKFYHREKVRDKVLTFVDLLGQPIVLRESDIDKAEDDMLDLGYELVSEKEITRWKVTKYLVSSDGILSTDVLPGEYIPVIPVYGERAFVEGEEHYEGVTRLAKDPQRLRNFTLSYLAEVLSRSPREKPIFLPEQIQGFEFMYEENGVDNNYPYYLINRNAGGQELPPGPVGNMPPPSVSPAMAETINQTRLAVEDVANPGLPQNISDPDISGKAVLALQARLDQQSLVYQENLKHAKRWDGVVYASMASDVYDTPRQVTMTMPDGTRKKAQVMEVIVDAQTGEDVVLNDLTGVEFDVYADIGPSYTTKKQETREELKAISDSIAQTDPNLHIALTLKSLALLDGINMEDIRDYANKQLVVRGLKEPETDDEIALMEQLANQPKQPDAAMILAQAEMLKGRADLMREQRESAKDQVTAQNDNAKVQIDAFKAQTDRAKVQVDAQKAGAEINYKNLQSVGQQIENASKVAMFRSRAN